MRVSSNKANIRVVFEESDTGLISSLGRRWEIEILQTAPPELMLRPVKIGGKVADADHDAYIVLYNRPAKFPRFASSRFTCEISSVNGACVLRPYEGIGAPRERNMREPRTSRPTSRKAEITMGQLVEAKLIINTAKAQMGDHLELGVTENGELRLTYMREL